MYKDVEIIVKDKKTGKPIKDVKVIVYCKDGSGKVYFTNEEGKCKVKIPKNFPGFIHIEAHKEGYETEQREITAGQIRLTIELLPEKSIKKNPLQYSPKILEDVDESPTEITIPKTMKQKTVITENGDRMKGSAALILFILLIVLTRLWDGGGFILWLILVVAVYSLYKYSSSIRTVNVTVLDQDNEPLSDARVILKDDGNILAEGYTDYRGMCILKTRKTDSIRVLINKEGFEHFEGELDDNDLTVNLQKSKPVKLSVKVVDENENPINDAEVQVYFEGKLKEQKSTVNGLAEFEISKGMYSITVRKKDYKRTTIDVALEKDEEIKVVLPIKKGILKITVIDEFRRPLRDIEVKVNNKKAKTNENGLAEIELPVGGHIVWVTDPNGVYEDTKINVVIDKTAPIDMVVVMKVATFYDKNEEFRKAINELESNVLKDLSVLNEWDTTIPNFVKSLCLTLIELAKRIPAKSDLAWEFLENLKKVCETLSTELKKPVYRTLYTRKQQPLQFDINYTKYLRSFELIFKEPHKAISKEEINNKIQQVDKIITSKMSELDITLPANLWKVAKSIAKKDSVVNIFIANVLLDYIKEMLTGELSERLRE